VTATATAEEIAAGLHLDVQRTRESLSRLKKRFVSRSDNGYEIPLTRLKAACHEVSAKGRKR